MKYNYKGDYNITVYVTDSVLFITITVDLC